MSSEAVVQLHRNLLTLLTIFFYLLAYLIVNVFCSVRRHQLLCVQVSPLLKLLNPLRLLPLLRNRSTASHCESQPNPPIRYVTLRYVSVRLSSVTLRASRTEKYSLLFVLYGSERTNRIRENR